MGRNPKGKPTVMESQYLPLLNYQSVFRTVRGKAPGTRRHVLRSVYQLSKGTGMDPDKFMAYAKSSDPLDILDRMEILGEPMKPGARIMFMVDVRSFLHHNGFNNLPKTNLTYVLKDWHRAYRKEEIQKLLSYLDQPFQ